MSACSIICPLDHPLRWAAATFLPANTGVSIAQGPEICVTTETQKGVTGLADALWALGRSFPSSGLMGDGSASSLAAVEEAAALVGHDAMEHWLTFRTYAAGPKLTLADVVWLAAVCDVPAVGLGPNVRRWRTQAATRLRGEEAENAESSKVNLGSQGSFAKMELTDARMGEVVVRFSPEPSGFLHLGHVKAMLLNDYYRRTYQGQLILRFDDTNPKKEKEEYVRAILEDLALLEVVPDRVTYTSDNFEHILERARFLIAKGRAYVDDQERDVIRAQRMAGEQSSARTLPIEEHLRRWDEMLAGSEEGCRCVLRALIPEAEQSNSALRDPALARCLGPEVEHPRTGRKFRCYPTYDLAISCCDVLEGVTHALRDSQYHERVPLYHWMLKQLEAERPPQIRQFGRINFTHTILSKRKLQWFVDQGLVSGWDDPAMPTVRGVLQRGLTVEALRLFILSQGASLSRTNMSMNKLWAVNKKIIDPVAPRYTAIGNDCFTLVLEGADDEIPSGEEGVAVEWPLHPKNPALGTKRVHRGRQVLVEACDVALLEADEEFTLMDWGNAVLLNVDTSARVLRARLHLAGDPRRTRRKMGWVLAAAACPVVRLVTLGHLITVPTLPQQKTGATPVDWTTVVNHSLRSELLCCGERAMAVLAPGDRIQLVRRGFFIVHACEPGELTLIDIPDGREGGASSLVPGNK